MIKSNLFLFIVLLLSLNAFAQANNVKRGTYTLRGKLLSKIGISTCGYIAFANVAEFEVLNFSDSNYTNINVPVILTCPDFEGENFYEQGKVYNLILADENQAEFSWCMIDDKQFLKKYNLRKNLWMIRISKE